MAVRALRVRLGTSADVAPTQRCRAHDAVTGKSVVLRGVGDLVSATIAEPHVKKS
jgi:hypothetical protein